MSDISPLPAGSPAPPFALPDALTAQIVSTDELRGQIMVLNFWSVDCPWSRKYDDYFAQRAAEWSSQGIALLFIASNANEEAYEVQDLAEGLGIAHPILLDRGNAVADAYGALTTPHVFVIDPAGRIAYQGAVDDQSFRQPQPTINYLDAAVAALKAGRMPDPADTPAYGCTIVRDFGDGP